MKIRPIRHFSVAVTTLALAAIALSLMPVRAWPLEILASFRVQLILGSALAAATALVLRLHFRAAAGIAITALQVAMVFPMLVAAERTDDPRVGRDSYTVLTLNLEWTNRSDEAVLRSIRTLAPDILCVQEADLWWRKRLSTLSDLYPYRAYDELSKRPGVALFSQVPIAEERWHPLHGRPYGTFVLEDGDRSFRVTTVHTLPPRSPLLYRARNRQLDDVALAIATDSDLPAIVAGDFNTTPWSPVMRDFIDATGLGNVRVGRGTLPTWPAWNAFLRVPIDHIFHSPGVRVEDVGRFPIADSDHIGLWAKLSLESAAG